MQDSRPMCQYSWSESALTSSIGLYIYYILILDYLWLACRCIITIYIYICHTHVKFSLMSTTSFYPISCIYVTHKPEAGCAFTCNVCHINNKDWLIDCMHVTCIKFSGFSNIFKTDTGHQLRTDIYRVTEKDVQRYRKVINKLHKQTMNKTHKY